jgi:hypothetical protein
MAQLQRLGDLAERAAGEMEPPDGRVVVCAGQQRLALCAGELRARCPRGVQQVGVDRYGAPPV